MNLKNSKPVGPTWSLQWQGSVEQIMKSKWRSITDSSTAENGDDELDTEQ